MEEIFSYINTMLPSPYSDLAAVAAIFIVLLIVAFILSFLFEEKKPKEPAQPESKAPLEEEPEAKAVPPPDLEVFKAPPHEVIGEPEPVPVKREAPPAREVKPAPEPAPLPEPKPLPVEPVREAKSAPAEPEPAPVTEAPAPVPEPKPEPEPVVEEVPETKEGLFARLRKGLSKTHTGFLGKLGEVISNREINDDLWDEFEETLIMADLGMGTTMKLRERVQEKLKKKSLSDSGAITDALKEEILAILKGAEAKPLSMSEKPFVIMIAGVNGVGKTTSIGKLASRFKKENREVMVAAGDTFRAAATEQLEVWSKRVGTDFIKGHSGADPSSVAFDAVKAASARGTDILIIDTAGRLHTKGNLMDEIKKMKRVISREMESAPHETFLVLDATTGQNAVQQAKMFNDALGVTGIVLTKLDGTAKGGVIIAIADELNIPVRFIGIGEALGDLREFNAEEFVEALFYEGGETVH
ncbi:MAG TPA: signal recognition particle-docking protein FtsY [Thermodesulfobacteriota bacterium]|nr:signal recognition particle-docking protein FtsY [Thermodesulfobacteriota bacterium]